MFHKFQRVFHRYCEANLHVNIAATDVCDSNGNPVVSFEQVCLEKGRLHLHGQSEAQAIGVRYAGIVQSEKLERAQFHVDVPFDAGPFEIHVKCRAETVVQSCVGVSKIRISCAKILLFLKFCFVLMSLSPQLYRWKTKGDFGARETAKERLGFITKCFAQDLPETLFECSATPVAKSGRQATIIMPVFNAFDLLCESLDHVARHSGEQWHLILVEDCSTDPRVRPYLSEWAQTHGDQVTLVLNSENVGFVGSVNKGFAIAQGRAEVPVVLLNSDAIVPPGWLNRLLAPLKDPSVASVTPMSNNAELLSVPFIGKSVSISSKQAVAIDRVAAMLNPSVGQAEIPTGVGFCMAISPQFFRKLPKFDTDFGKGYGEEVDWCQKVRQLGGKHIGIGSLFVEHRGTASFDLKSKQWALKYSGELLTQRYPRYDTEVQEFCNKDKLVGPRLALAMTWVGGAQTDPVYVFLAHSLGGGAEQYLNDRIAGILQADQSCVVLRVGQKRRWTIELHSKLGVFKGLTDDFDLVQNLINLLPNRQIVYSCGVGDPDAATLPELLLRLADDKGGSAAEIEVLIHDYFPVSPSYTLLDLEGRYHGVPNPRENSQIDQAHTFVSTGGKRTDLAEWQRRWATLMCAAKRIVLFSENSRELLSKVYPKAAPQMLVAPHRVGEGLLLENTPAPEGEGCIVGVLGNIGGHKGSRVLAALSQCEEPELKLVVLGNVEPELRPSSGLTVHGSYRKKDLPMLVHKYGIQAWLMPSVWPETFSFTTHEMLATGLPVASFDVGAQGEAVSGAINAGAEGAIVPLDQAFSPDLARSITDILHLH